MGCGVGDPPNAKTIKKKKKKKKKKMFLLLITYYIPNPVQQVY
jgi:hypothetical protein